MVCSFCSALSGKMIMFCSALSGNVLFCCQILRLFVQHYLKMWRFLFKRIQHFFLPDWLLLKVMENFGFGVCNMWKLIEVRMTQAHWVADVLTYSRTCNKTVISTSSSYSDLNDCVRQMADISDAQKDIRSRTTANLRVRHASASQQGWSCAMAWPGGHKVYAHMRR